MVPADWVAQATAKQTPSVSDGYIDNMCGYGFQFWRNPLPNSYRCDGLFGQRCFFLPEYDAMMVLNCGQSEDYKIMKVFWKHFPEAFGPEHCLRMRRVRRRCNRRWTPAPWRICLPRPEIRRWNRKLAVA